MINSVFLLRIFMFQKIYKISWLLSIKEQFYQTTKQILFSVVLLFCGSQVLGNNCFKMCNPSFWQTLSIKSLEAHIETNNINSRGEDGITPLHVASGFGTSEHILKLLDAGASLNARTIDGYSPLHLAAAENASENITTLLGAGSHVDLLTERNFTPLHIAAAIGAVDSIKILLESGADINALTKSDETPLHRAARAKNEIGALMLVEAGSEVNFVSVYGTIPLHNAARVGSAKTIKILLEAGSEIDVCNNFEETPLFEAVKSGSSENLDMLLSAGARINTFNDEGLTSLHEAASQGAVKKIKLLIAAGADINSIDKTRLEYTPLHHASKFSTNPEAVILLIDAGASTSAETNFGKTALDLIKNNYSLKNTDAFWKLNDITLNNKHKPKLRSKKIFETEKDPTAESILESLKEKKEPETCLKLLPTQNERLLDIIRNKMKPCWNPPVGVENGMTNVMILGLKFDIDGKLAESPVNLTPNSGIGSLQAFEAARRAVIRCSPYEELDPEIYESWKELILKFNPKNMGR